MADYYRDLVRLLREGGYEFKRQGRGDHEIWWNPKSGIRVTVDRKLKSKFTANGVLEGSRTSEGFLTPFPEHRVGCAALRPPYFLVATVIPANTSA